MYFSQMLKTIDIINDSAAETYFQNQFSLALSVLHRNSSFIACAATQQPPTGLCLHQHTPSVREWFCDIRFPSVRSFLTPTKNAFLDTSFLFFLYQAVTLLSERATPERERHCLEGVVRYGL